MCECVSKHCVGTSVWTRLCVCTCECVSKYFVHEPKQEDVLKCVTLACVHNMQMCANVVRRGCPGLGVPVCAQTVSMHSFVCWHMCVPRLTHGNSCVWYKRGGEGARRAKGRMCAGPGSWPSCI